MKAKSYIVLMCLLLSVCLQAQQTKNIDTNQFGIWQLEQGLSATTNSSGSLESSGRLEVRNITGEKIFKSDNTLNLRSAVLNMNWKPTGNFQIDFMLSNKKTDPYKYTQEPVYWGVFLELYKTDGSIIRSGIMLSSDRYEALSNGKVASRYSYNIYNNGKYDEWKRVGRSSENEYKHMTLRITCENNRLDITSSRCDWNCSNIAGVKSISIMVGSEAEVSVYNFRASIPSPKIDSQPPSGGGTQPSSGDWQGNGTGFFVDSRGYIATNYHVIEDATDIEIEFFHNGQKKVYRAEVVQSDSNNDLAILKIKGYFGLFTSIPYNFKTSVDAVGTSVFALGYPMALSIMGTDIKFTDGKISSLTGIGGTPILYQISVPIQPGNSGGPLFDYAGNLIGITAATLDREKFQTENVNYAVKSSYLSSLIDALPIRLNLPTDSSTGQRPLTEQIKILSNYVVLIKIK
jgi:S1-C subfamily serine protease